MKARRRQILSIVLLFGVAALLRITLASRHGLWADEFFSLAMATGHSLEHPAAEAVPVLGDFVESPEAVSATTWGRYLEHEHPPGPAARVVRAVLLSDTSPPLYYLLLYGWTRAFGTTDLALRLFSVMWALAAFPLLYLVGRRLGGRRVAVAACLLFTLAPASLYYSVEGRMYSLLWFLVLATAWLSLRLHDRGVRPMALPLWTLTGAAGLLTHYFFAFVWAACLMWLWLYPGRFPRRWLLAAAVGTGLLVLPWYLQVPASLGRWRITGSWLDGPLSLGQALTAPFTLAWRLLSGRGPWGGDLWVERIGVGLFLVLILVVATRAPRSVLSRGRRLVWFWLLFACAGPLTFDLLRGTHTSLVPRYALTGLPAAMLLAGMAMNRLGPALNATFLALVVLSWLPGIRVVWLNGTRSWDVYRQVAVRVAEWAGPSDLVVVHSIPSGVVGIARYLTPQTQVAAWIEQLGGRRVPEDIVRLLHGRGRVALVVIHSGAPAPEEGWLENHATPAGGFQLLNARVLYFEGRASP
ncbi:MAG: glycosyltransferase family 39 protein [Gemmatimonadales bacterium]|nr:glycosyltransferase family 39 protein [Gemmatimonadales bacterium]